MPFGFGGAGNTCPTCGCGMGQGGQLMPGTYTHPGMHPGMGTGFGGFGAPGFGPGFGRGFGMGFGPGFGGMGMGFGGPGFTGFGPTVTMEEMATTGPGFAPFVPGPMALGWGLGGTRRWGGTYTPQFLMTGLPTDQEIVEMVYDSFDNDPLIPFDADINVDSDAGVVTLTGTVASKQVKHAAGDDAWWIPGVDDVRNDLAVERRHPARAAETGQTTTPTGRRGAHR